MIPNKKQIRDQLRKLRTFINAEDGDEIAKRIAYEIECAVRWTLEDTDEWPSFVEMATSAADLIEADIDETDK